jgi:hypothetical protein
MCIQKYEIKLDLSPSVQGQWANNLNQIYVSVLYLFVSADVSFVVHGYQSLVFKVFASKVVNAEGNNVLFVLLLDDVTGSIRSTTFCQGSNITGVFHSENCTF